MASGRKTAPFHEKSNLAGGSWGAAGYSINTANGTNCITINPPQENLFFRLSR